VTAEHEGESAAGQAITFVDVTHEALIREWPRLLRYVATMWVKEGEAILGDSSVLTASHTLSNSSSVSIQPLYLEWAGTVAPKIAGWSPDLPLQRQQAIISATALFSQALALNPPSDTPVYVWIEPGEFVMGSTDEQVAQAVKLCGEGCDASDFTNEQQPHTVPLDGYWIQRTEVTNEQYKRCYDAGGCPDKPDNSAWNRPTAAKLPVTDVDWNQAKTYAEWVGGRLPSEAEWEDACRRADGRIYPWGDELPSKERLNYNYDVGGTTDVGDYPPGANGLYDMAGNVWEWTSSEYRPYSYDANDGRENPETGESRTLRGGSFLFDDYDVRCANRDIGNTTVGNFNLGFRVVSPGF